MKSRWRRHKLSIPSLSKRCHAAAEESLHRYQHRASRRNTEVVAAVRSLSRCSPGASGAEMSGSCPDAAAGHLSSATISSLVATSDGTWMCTCLHFVRGYRFKRDHLIRNNLTAIFIHIKCAAQTAPADPHGWSLRVDGRLPATQLPPRPLLYLPR